MHDAPFKLWDSCLLGIQLQVDFSNATNYATCLSMFWANILQTSQSIAACALVSWCWQPSRQMSSPSMLPFLEPSVIAQTASHPRGTLLYAGPLGKDRAPHLPNLHACVSFLLDE